MRSPAGAAGVALWLRQQRQQQHPSLVFVFLLALDLDRRYCQSRPLLASDETPVIFDADDDDIVGDEQATRWHKWPFRTNVALRRFVRRNHTTRGSEP